MKYIPSEDEVQPNKAARIYERFERARHEIDGCISEMHGLREIKYGISLEIFPILKEIENLFLRDLGWHYIQEKVRKEEELKYPPDPEDFE